MPDGQDKMRRSTTRRRHHRRGAGAVSRDPRPAAAADHAGPDQAPARLRQGGRADRGRVVPGDRDPDRSRQDVQRQAAGIHPVLRHARGVDGGRPDRPPQTRRRHRIDRVRPVSPPRRAGDAGWRQHRPSRHHRHPGARQRPGARPRRASRSPARCSMSGRRRPTASTIRRTRSLDGLHMRGKFRTDARGPLSDPHGACRSTTRSRPTGRSERC